MKTLASEAYKSWKASHKINMRVYSDEEMFMLGHESRDAEVEELLSLIAGLIENRTELKEQIDALKNTVGVIAEKPKKTRAKKDAKKEV